jgi:hypothetical protein
MRFALLFLFLIKMLQGRVINTMSFYEALPPFGVKQWRLVTLLLLDALSVQRLPGIVLSNNRAIMRKVLQCIIFFILELRILHEVEVVALQVLFLGFKSQQCPFYAQAE